MRYANFDLWIDAKVGDRYPVRAASPLGEVRGSIAFDSHWSEIQQVQDQLAKREIDQQKLIEFGRQLYELLFNDQIELLFEQSAGSLLQQEDHGLRIRLRIEAPELIVLSWEFLYWPRKECFLGTAVRYPIIRYLEIFEAIDNLEVSLPLKMLVVIPQTAELDTEHEKATLLSTLQELRKAVEVVFLEGVVTFSRLSDALLEVPFHLLHFIGHGEFENDQAFLQLNSANGETELVDDATLANLFSNHSTLKLVFLNSCKGAETSAATPFAGMAYGLVKRGIPAVVAMQYAIYDEAAILFSQEFYRSLFRGHHRGRVEFAISHARNRVRIQFPEEREMGAPVLFLRASEGLLFNILAVRTPAEFTLSNKERDRHEAVKATYLNNIKSLEHEYQNSTDSRVKTLLDQNMVELNRVEQQIRRRRIVFVMMVGTSLFIFFLSWLKAFDFLPPAVRIESYTLWIASLFSKRQPKQQAVLVTITDKTEKAIGKPFGKEWRGQHALLIDRLSKAGARVIAFDLYFEEPSPYDAALAAAIQQAAQRQTTVIVGFRSLVEDQPHIVKPLQDAGVQSGLLCLGKKWGTAQVAPLVVVKAGRPSFYPSLALAVDAAFQQHKILIGQDIQEVSLIDPASQQIVHTIVASESAQVRWAQPGCPAIAKGDDFASLIIDPAMLERVTDPTLKVPYETIIQQWDDRQALPFKDKVVLVGIERKDDQFPFFLGLKTEERHGVELHLAAIHSLLSGLTIRPLSESQQLLIMVLLGLMGSFMGLNSPRSSRLVRAGLFTLIVLLHLGTGQYLFNTYLILLNPGHDLLAFGTAYATAGKVRKRWFQ